MFKKLITFPLAFLLFFSACKKDEPTTDEGSGGIGNPATEHHSNDGSVDNRNGTFTITLGNKTFNTTVRDFSSEPVVTDPKLVTAVKKADFGMSNYLSRFKVDRDHINGALTVDAFTSKLTVYSISKKKETSNHNPDFYIAGFDYNGAMMTIEGAEDLNFYMVDNGVITDHFFHVAAFKGSKFLSECYMDQSVGYVYNSDEIVFFPLHNTKDFKTMNVTIPDFSQLRFSSDENYLYLSIGGYTDSEVKILDKKNNYAEVASLDLKGKSLAGITVDANYIYVSDVTSSSIFVYNKHNQADAGSFSLTSPNALDIIGSTLYVSNKTDKKIETYEVTFQ